MIISRKILVGIAIFTVMIVGTFYVLKTPKLQIQISSFEECAEAGYPILESYPEQCVTPDGRTFTRDLSASEIPNDVLEHISGKSDLIVVHQPKPLSTISSPLTVRGEARGYWFFEGDFPIMLVDWDGRIIAESFASFVQNPEDPQLTWMTEEFVQYEGVLTFEDPSWEDDFSKRGVLVLQKDNPSGLSENDDALEIPILFAPMN